MTLTSPTSPAAHKAFILARLPPALRTAPEPIRQRLRHLALAAETARYAFKEAAQALPQPDTFAFEPLRQALAQTLGHPQDPRQAVLHWVDPKGKRPVLQHTLLEAALLNFHHEHTQPGAYGPGSGLFAAGTHGEPDLTRPLKLRPDEFAKQCRALDIGGRFQAAMRERLPANLPGRETPVGDEQPLAWLAYAAQRRAFLAEACLARVEGRLSEEGEALLARWGLSPNGAVPLSASRDVQVHRLTLFEFPLAGPLVFSAPAVKGAPARLVAYLPGAAQGAIEEYENAQHLASALGSKLADPAFRRFFSGFTSLDRRLAFIERIKAAIAPGGWLPRHLRWSTDLLGGDPFVEGYRIWAQQTLAEAATVAVPTHQMDVRDAHERYAHWVEVGEQLGTSLALMVGSALPGVNVIADAIVLAQGLYSIYEGVEAWQRGDTEGALEQVFAAVENAGFFGLGKRPEPVAAAQRFGDQLVPVTGSDGQVRLWLPDLDDFRARELPPPHVQADAAGLYRHGGRAWLTLEGRFHEIEPDATPYTASLRHPTRRGHAPQLVGNGRGAWRGAHEQVQKWQGAALLRRLAPRYAGWPDARLLDAQRLAGISDSQLRNAHLDGASVPALLSYVLARRSAAEQLDAVIKALRDGRALDEVPPVLVGALRDIPGWPSELSIDYTGSDGSSTFGPVSDGPRVALAANDLSDGRWAGRLISQLQPRQQDALLGQDTSLVPAEHAHQVLAERWAVALDAHRQRLIALQRENVDLSTPARATLVRQFPGLPEQCIEALETHADSVQRQALAAGRMPPALGVQAAQALRQVRVVDACERLAQGVASAEHERLVFALLPRLGAWAAQLNLTLHANRTGGEVLQRTTGSGPRRLIVRSAGGYQVFDEGGRELGAQVSLEQAIVDSLPGAIHSVAATAPGTGEALRLALYDHALAHRDDLRPMLGLARDNRRFFRAPTRQPSGAIGYELSGRGQLPGPRPPLEDPLLSALRGLYPEVSEAQLIILRTRLGEGEQATLALGRLHADIARLRLELQQWVERAPDNAAEDAPADEAGNRRAIADELIGLWHRRDRTLAYGGLGYGLTLRSFRVSDLPALTVRFDHVERVLIQDIGLARIAPSFLAGFPNARWLDLSMNTLVELPNLSNFPHLQRLSLDFTGRRTIAEVCEVLQPATQTLQHLDLASTELTLSMADIALLAQFPRLQILDLECNEIILTEETAAAFGSLSALEELNLTSNPLGRAPQLGNLGRLVLFGASDAGLSQFPPGLFELMDRNPLALREVNLSENHIVEVPELANTRFVQRMLTARNDVRSPDYDMGVNLNGNPLSGAARERLEQAGIEFYDNPLGPLLDDPQQADQWLIGCPEALRALIEAERTEHEAAEFYQLLGRVIDTADYAHEPGAARARAWRLAQTWLQPGDQALPGLEDLRDRLFEMARDTMGTCGDGVALTLDDMEFEAEAWRIIAGSQATGDGPLQELLAFQRRLWRRVLVDDSARRITRARVARERVIRGTNADADTAPPLDPLDDLADARLADGIDEVEVRFYLLQQLQYVLDLPATRGMIYSTQVSPATVQRVAAEVQVQDTPTAFVAWVAGRPGFRRYLEYARRALFEPVRQRWHEAADALYSLPIDADAPMPPALAGLREALPAAQWPAEPGRWPVLNEQQLREAYAWVSQRQQAELDALALSETRALLGLNPPAEGE